MAWLKKLTTAFERIRWHSARIMWRPAVGTNKDGRLLMAVDWDGKHENTTAQSVSALTPIADVPLWQATTLNLPPSRLQTRKEYFIDSTAATERVDRSPASIAVYIGAATTGVVGHLWITYDVSLFGTA